jgi:hypothetical protein
MASIIITSITGSSPYDITVCDMFGNNCVFFLNITPTFPVILSLPVIYNTAPVVTITVTDSLGCSQFKVLYCGDSTPDPKQFQDGEFFFFMDDESYEFQN